MKFQIDGKPVTVVGIAPPGFFGGELRSWGPDFWIPLADEPYLRGSSSLLQQADANWLNVLGRLRPGTDPNALEAQLKLELREWQMSHLPDMSPQEKEFLPRQALHLTPGGAGVTEMRVLTIGMPYSCSISSPTSTSLPAERQMRS